MMQINGNTKLAKLFKLRPEALEAIVSVNEKFEKLRNSFLRKIMAPRTSISMAAKIGGCDVRDIYKVLEPLGFAISPTNEKNSDIKKNAAEIPFVKQQDVFDARPILSKGKDPLRAIMSFAASVKPGETFCVINSFEPLPLIDLLAKQGFETVSVQNSELEYHTFFKRTSKNKQLLEATEAFDWQAVEEQFRDHCLFVDVRKMNAPLPMVTILRELDHLPDGYALHVHHKRVPVHLFPEIKDRGFEYALKESGKDDVHLMIFPAA